MGKEEGEKLQNSMSIEVYLEEQEIAKLKAFFDLLCTLFFVFIYQQFGDCVQPYSSSAQKMR